MKGAVSAPKSLTDRLYKRLPRSGLGLTLKIDLIFEKASSIGDKSGE